ncbi:MAG: PstS family phosphate ABC transporter substrate-binding protein [Deinococcales bacterium]
MNKILIILATLLLTISFAQKISVDGSSTVYPITFSMAEEFAIDSGAEISVAFSGTGGGFKKFCAGETDVSNASRPIKQSEIDQCAQNGISYSEIAVAWDALTVVVNPKNAWLECITVNELHQMWMPGSAVKNWSDVSFSHALGDVPEVEIELYAPGVDSGTFDYFTEVVNEEAGSSRTDFFPSEDDTVLVQGVEGNLHALGYFGYAYYLGEGSKLKALAIDNGDGCVLPSAESIEDGSYTPLSRPLYIYVNNDKASENSELADFISYYLDPDNTELIADTGYSPLSEEEYGSQLEAFNNR